MSILNLPHEVLDLVFSQVHDKTAPPTGTHFPLICLLALKLKILCRAVESQTAFSSLCLTSKSFLPLAREHLYYRPFRFRENDRSLEKFLGLLPVLQQLQSPLSPLVRSLEGITSFLDQLTAGEDPSDPSSSDDLQLLAQYGTSYKFLYRLLEICSNLHTLELALYKSEQLAEVTQSLAISAPTIKTLHLRESMQPVLQETLDHHTFRHVETLIITEIDSPIDLVGVIPSIKLPLRALQFDRRTLNIGLLKPFIPDNLPSLVDFTLSYDRNQHSKINIVRALDLLPTALQRLSITWHSRRMRISSPPSLDRYGCDPDYHEIPLDSLARFTSLRTLSLHRFQGHLLALLQTLTKSSPSLQSIDFLYSRWIPHDRTALLTPESMFPSTEIYDTLCTFPFLRYIHLGYLPTSRREDYEDLVDKLRERGIRDDWMECRPKKVEL